MRRQAAPGWVALFGFSILFCGLQLKAQDVSTSTERRSPEYAALSHGSPVLDVLSHFDRIAGKGLWPGFAPAEIPIAVYDGTNTYLYHHPQPPKGFRRVDGVAGLFVCPGRHESVQANTSAELGGVLTATASISGGGRQSPQEMAALLIHESFHVYEKQNHPGWAANEVSLFTYPVDNLEVLRDRRLETLALVKAIQTGSAQAARCWASAALEQRQHRFGHMSADAVAYDRGTELNEGLAQYVEYRSIQKSPALQADDFPAELFRHRGYATGQAYATLLDRFVPGWKTQITDSLDELLAARMPKAGNTCSFSAQEVTVQQERAMRDIEQLVRDRKQRRQQFEDTTGWTLQVIAGNEPLWPQMFDPWNLAVLQDKEVIHWSLLKLGNNSGEIEIHDRSSLTQGAGPHPLFAGARQVIVKGLDSPQLTQSEGKVSIEAVGVKATFAGTVAQSGKTITVTLP